MKDQMTNQPTFTAPSTAYAENRAGFLKILAARVLLKVSGTRMWLTEQDALESSVPRTVGAEINNTCNADCTFCGYGKGPDGKAADPRNKGMLDIEVFRHLLKLYSEGGGGSFALSPILGEVTTDRRWLELVREARSFRNVTGVTCFTNGILLDTFGSEEILTSGLSAMNISTAFGSREQYKRLYGKDNYDRVVRNILDILRVNLSLGKPVHVTLLLRIDKPYENFLSSPLYSEIAELIDPKEIKILDDFWDDFKGIIQQDGLPKGHVFKESFEDKQTPCYALYRKLQVMTDGEIQACSCRVEPELWAGNVLDYDTLESAWRNPKLESLRSKWHAGTIPECCKRCSHYMPFTNLVSMPNISQLASVAAKRVLRGVGILPKSKLPGDYGEDGD